jgi:hypothetical protein
MYLSDKAYTQTYIYTNGFRTVARRTVARGRLLAGHLLARTVARRTIARRIFARKTTSMWIYEEVTKITFKKSNGK